MNNATPTPERWLPAPDWEGWYEVSDLGRVRSVPHDTEMGLRGGHVLKPGSYKSGHKYVTFTRVTDAGKERATLQVHRLVMRAFADHPCPEGMQVRHLDGNPENNRLTNLAYGTAAENARDRDEVHGRNHHSNKTHCPQDHEYTEENTYWYKGARQCRACRNGGRPAEECDDFGCSNPAKSRGLCHKHYQRWLRSNLSPEKREKIKAKDREYARRYRARQNRAPELVTGTLF
jgi:HNH endonuclease/NUMOD4 motif-containing protein